MPDMIASYAPPQARVQLFTGVLRYNPLLPVVRTSLLSQLTRINSQLANFINQTR
jgi:hypothetical protein